MISPGFHSGSQHAALPSPPVLRCYSKPEGGRCPGWRWTHDRQLTQDYRALVSIRHSCRTPRDITKQKADDRVRLGEYKVPADHLGLTHLNLPFFHPLHPHIPSLSTTHIGNITGKIWVAVELDFNSPFVFCSCRHAAWPWTVASITPSNSSPALHKASFPICHSRPHEPSMAPVFSGICFKLLSQDFRFLHDSTADCSSLQVNLHHPPQLFLCPHPNPSLCLCKSWPLCLGVVTLFSTFCSNLS